MFLKREPIIVIPVDLLRTDVPSLREGLRALGHFCRLHGLREPRFQFRLSESVSEVVNNLAIIAVLNNTGFSQETKDGIGGFLVNINRFIEALSVQNALGADISPRMVRKKCLEVMLNKKSKVMED